MINAESAPRALTGLVPLNLSVLGGGFAWFAYIDAPITDGAMLMIAAAVAAGLLSIGVEVYRLEAAPLPVQIGVESVPRPARRVRRPALIFFMVSLTLMLAAATLTLNLKGTGTDAQETQTAAV